MLGYFRMFPDEVRMGEYEARKAGERPNMIPSFLANH